MSPRSRPRIPRVAWISRLGPRPGFTQTRIALRLPVSSQEISLASILFEPAADSSPSFPRSSHTQGDATYIIVKDDGTIENYGLNAVCTHLGCVVPWNKAENKFKCPCHGSQYNNEGKVIRGPAPLSLALAHANINDADVVVFSGWTETDFRTGLEPWWK